MHINALLALLLLPALAAGASTAPINILDGKVVHVADGDTITVLDSNHLEQKVRLAGIDAPEKAQPYGDRSKQSLVRLVQGKPVRVEWNKQDRYGRLVGKVWVASPDSPCGTPPCPQTLDSNLAQLTAGLAWHYKEYEKEQSPQDRQRYAFAEQEARARHAGLWADPDPTAPWDWRHGPKEGPVKMSKSGICHAPDSSSYQSVKNFEPFPTIDACLAAGGRLPKKPAH